MHNVILIIVSSKWSSFFFPELFIMSHSRFEMLHLFFSGVPSFLGYIVAKLHLNHCKDSPCVFNFSFFLSSFYYRSSPWRLYMMVHQGFNSFSKCSSRFFSEEFKHSSSCIPKCNSPTLSFEMVLCHPWQFLLMFHDSHILNPSFSISSWDPLQPINLFIGVILGYISPKAFPKECCYCGAY